MGLSHRRGVTKGQRHQIEKEVILPQPEQEIDRLVAQFHKERFSATALKNGWVRTEIDIPYIFAVAVECTCAGLLSLCRFNGNVPRIKLGPSLQRSAETFAKYLLYNLCRAIFQDESAQLIEDGRCKFRLPNKDEISAHESLLMFDLIHDAKAPTTILLSIVNSIMRENHLAIQQGQPLNDKNTLNITRTNENQPLS